MSTQLSAADLLYGQVRVPPARGSWEFLLAYRSSPWLRALTAKVASTTSSIDWYVTTGRGKSPKRIPDHPLPRLLDAGNEMMTGHQVRQLTVAHYLVVGEAHWLIIRDALHTPVALMPLVPTWVVTTPRPGRSWYDIAVTEGGFVGRIAASEIISFKDVDLYRPYDRGTGIAMALDNELGADAEAARYTAGYLANNARPDLIITANTSGGRAGLKPSEADALKATWMDKFGGPSKRGLPLISSGDIDVKEIGKSMQEMEFVKLREFERNICISAFGVPPEIMGVLANSNRATVQAAQETLGRQVILPMLTTLREVMQKWLVPQFDDRLVLNFESPVPEDQERRDAALKDRPWMASVNEHRTSTGFDELPGSDGEVFPEPINLQFVKRHTEEPVKPDVPEPPGAIAPPKSWTALMSSRTKVGRDDAAKEAVAQAADADVIIDATEPLVKEIVDQFGTDAGAGIQAGFSFDLNDPAVSGFINSFGGDRITGLVNETTRDAIRDAISSVWDEGGTFKDITAGIEDVFDAASSARAALIAATETNRAANFATMSGFDQAGAEGKEWLSTRDDLVRDTEKASHVALDGQQVAADENFKDPVSGEEGLYPGGFDSAAEVCNCRCSMVPVITLEGGDEEASALNRGSIYDTEEKRKRQWNLQNRQKLAFEKHFVVKLKSAFAKQRVAVLREAARRFG